MTRRLAYVTLALVCGLASAHAADKAAPPIDAIPTERDPQPSPPAVVPEGALEVTATGTLEWLKDQNLYVARKNAVARRNDTTLKGDELVAHYEVPAGKKSGTEITQVTAEGNPVEVLSPTAVAYGQHGIYDVAKHVVVLKGNNLKLVTTDDVVTARDSLEYYEDTGIGVARGDAVALRGDDKLTADLIAAKFVKKNPDDKQEGTVKGGDDKPNSRLERLDAKGHVVLVTPTDVITGDEGVYNPILDQATVLGNVHVTRGENQLDGARAEVDMATGISRVYPAEKTLVKALLVPKKKDAAPKPAADAEAGAE